MQEASIFYKGRMSWLNEIQLFRKDLQRMKGEVYLLENDTGMNNIAKDQIQSFNEAIQMIDRELDYTEKSILFSLNNGKNYWVDAYGNSSNPHEVTPIEDDLFERMKNNYTSIIDLLKSINNYCLQTDFSM